MVNDFETQLKQMAESRVKKQQEFYNSENGKLYFLEIDFKCWCHSKGKFYNLNEEDFKAYKQEFNIELEFALQMLVYEKWFGYEFEFDSKTEKWKTVKNKKWVLNRKS